MQLEYSEIFNSLQALVPAGSVFELRLLGARKGQVDSGYFDCAAQAANALVSNQGHYKGIYFTPNPVTKDALARSYNRITPWAQVQTHDPEVTRRRWLLVDIDAKRPAGISSSDAEHEAALNKARTIAGMLTLMYGFCTPTLNDSGNGAHLMYPMDEANTDEVRDQIHTFLKILNKLYGDSQCDVDVTVYNAARIWRVPGTWARKGDSTPDRPHRRARVLTACDPFQRLDFNCVRKVNAIHAGLLARDGNTGAVVKKNLTPQDESLFKRLNEHAMQHVKVWAPHFFPTAREYKEGYRVASGDINQPYEEDLTIHPWPLGIKYFGVSDQGDGAEGRRTPVGIIAEYALNSDKLTAATKLSELLNYPISELGAIPAQVAGIGHNGGPGIEGLLGSRKQFDFKAVRSVSDLQRATFQEIRWIVEGVIPAGNMLLAARPKMRKTWLALQLCMAIASGRQFLDWQCNKGDVLFLGLEDNERRMQNRIRTLQKFEINPPDLSGFRYWTGGMGYDNSGRLKLTNPEEQARTLEAFPRGEAGVDALEQYLEQYPNTSTIVIDTLAHFRGERTSRDVYQSDYESMMPLTKLASRKGILVMPVMHEKKGLAAEGNGADFLEHVTGSAGITGGADGVISIKGRRGVQEENESRKLLVSGRDVPYDYEQDITFDAERGGWLKAAKEDVKVALRALLERHPYLNQKDIQNLLPSAGQARLYRCLTDMKLQGEIEQGKYGYSLKR